MSKKLFFNLVLVLALVLGSISVVSAADEVYLGTSIRSLDNPYHAKWKEGGEMFARTVGLEDYHRTLLCEGSSEEQVDDIKSLLATAGKDVVFNIDPNQSPNVRPIVEMLEAKGVYYVTNWNKPEDMHPWDYKYWVAHIGYDNVNSGYQTAKALFEAIGGEGQVLAIQGMLANTASQERDVGFQKALKEYPEIELVGKQPADWSRTEAYNVTENLLLANPGVDGIWAANDSMALGVIEALRSQGLAGQIPVTGTDGIDEAFEAIRNGEMVATAVNNAHWQGGIGLSIAFKAYTGEIDPSSLPKSKQEYAYKATIVTKENVDSFVKNFVENVPEYDFNTLWPEDGLPVVK